MLNFPVMDIFRSFLVRFLSGLSTSRTKVDGRTDEQSLSMEAYVLRFLSVRVHAQVRVRTLVRSADFVQTVSESVPDVSKNLMSELLSVSDQLCPCLERSQSRINRKNVIE